jgi:hypothetical protein
LHGDDRLIIAFFGGKRFQLEFVFLDRRRDPAFDVDLTAHGRVFVANDGVVGETAKN